MFYDQIVDCTLAPHFGSQCRGETPQEVMERFWHETLATHPSLPNHAVFLHFAGGINLAPWLVGCLASVLCAPDHVVQMDTAWVPILTSVFRDPPFDISYRDAMASPSRAAIMIIWFTGSAFPIWWRLLLPLDSGTSLPVPAAPFRPLPPMSLHPLRLSTFASRLAALSAP